MTGGSGGSGSNDGPTIHGGSGGSEPFYRYETELVWLKRAALGLLIVLLAIVVGVIVTLIPMLIGSS